MARGSGLSIDPSSSSDPIRFCFDHHHRPKHKMEAESNGSQLSTIQLNLSCSNTTTNAPSDDDEGVAPAPSDCHDRTAINEMDFFARNNCKEDHHQEPPPASATSADNEDRVIDVNIGLHLLTANTGSDQSTVDDGISPNSMDKRSLKSIELGALQAEVERVNRENQQLRDMLNQVTNNYNALQMQLATLMQQQQLNRHDDCKFENDKKEENNADDRNCSLKQSIGPSVESMRTVPRQFMDLGLADCCNEPNSYSFGTRTLARRSRSPPDHNHDGEGGSLDNGHGWIPNKAPRLIESSSKTNGSCNTDQATEVTMRKARVSVRARSEAPMISDGCQWRKYGQKMAKGNPCPRAYYRCTMAGGCPVRKQVQRCAEDRTILITTYEGTHSHPLPPAAMMMASATSSAARMLLSGSMSSPDGTGLISHPSNFLAYSRSLFPCSSSSVATISASAPFPTITLDLTHSPNTSTNSNPLHELLQKPNHFPAPFAGTSILPPQLFGKPLYNQSRFPGFQVSGQDGMPQNSINNPVADTVTALTTDPNFTAALAAAIRSLIGNGSANNSNNHHDNNSNSHHVTATTSDSHGNDTDSYCHGNISNGN